MKTRILLALAAVLWAGVVQARVVFSEDKTWATDDGIPWINEIGAAVSNELSSSTVQVYCVERTLTVIVTVQTNWVEKYEQIPEPQPWWFNWTNNIIIPCTPDLYVRSSDAVYTFTTPTTTQGRLLGREGTVVRVTEIRFDYEGSRVLRYETPTERIWQAVREKPAVEWEDPIRTPLPEPTQTVTNTLNIATVTVESTLMVPGPLNAATNVTLERILERLDKIDELASKLDALIGTNTGGLMLGDLTDTNILVKIGIMTYTNPTLEYLYLKGQLLDSLVGTNATEKGVEK